jgi:hypothetical protein
LADSQKELVNLFENVHLQDRKDEKIIPRTTFGIYVVRTRSEKFSSGLSYLEWDHYNIPIPVSKHFTVEGGGLYFQPSNNL